MRENPRGDMGCQLTRGKYETIVEYLSWEPLDM
jgi:hypothetical protein